VRLKHALALAVAAFVAGAGTPSLPADTSEREILTIAALPFTEASADKRYAPLAEAIGDILMARLSEAEGLTFVERAAIDKVHQELELTAAAGAADQTRLGRTLGAQFVLTGSLTSSDNSLQLVAHLLEVSTTRVVRSAQVTARADDLVEPVDQLARDLVGQFSRTLPELPEGQVELSPDANLSFMRGLGYYYAGMPEHAATQFLKTLAIAPGHAEARFYSGLNYFDRAKEYGHAKIEFARFLKQFGDHRLAARAREKLQQCESRLGNPAERQR